MNLHPGKQRMEFRFSLLVLLSLVFLIAAQGLVKVTSNPLILRW